MTSVDTILDKTSKITAKQDPVNQNTFILSGKDKETGSYITQSYSFSDTSNALTLGRTTYHDKNEAVKISKIGGLEVLENSVFVGVEYSTGSYSTQILNRKNMTYVVANMTNFEKKPQII